MKNIMFLLIIASVSCQPVKHSVVVSVRSNKIQSYALSDLKEGEFIMAAEKCENDNISFCYPMRLPPLQGFIVFDSIDVIRSYYNGYYRFFVERTWDTTLNNILKTIPNSIVSERVLNDTSYFMPMVDNKDSIGHVHLKNKHYFKRLKRFEKKELSGKCTNTNFFEYDLYRVRMKYVYAGTAPTHIPAIKSNKRNTLFIFDTVPYYLILDIVSISPYRTGKVYQIEY